MTPMLSTGEFSLYFHIPFCTRKCDYCHFYVLPDQERFKKIYMEALRKEWIRISPSLPDGQLVSIYFGGGTPALLGPDLIQEILSWISPPSPCEITLEANPENVSLELMRAFFRAKINRISLGVQTLDNTLLNTLSRTHHAERALHAAEECSEAGFNNISIDLMYDLPGQTLASWQETLDQALCLPIHHLSLYNLTIEPHTVFYKKRKSLKLPDSDTSLHMLHTAVAALKSNGFERYEISAFARKGKASKHNCGYWQGRPFLGLGPSACSDWGGSRFRNCAHLHKWAKALNEGRSAIDFTETLEPKERTKEGLAIGLRLIQGVPIVPWSQDIEKGLASLEQRGFLEQQDNHYRLSAFGLLFHDTVAEEIMSL